ncbi:MAG: glycosyltransferase [Candidatus Gastranaerophilales bacterium]
MEPYITIITPTHNIIENQQMDDFNRLVSMLDIQTYKNIEHLVIDNASTDGTVEVLKEYKNKGYLNFYSEKDMGKFGAYNKGIIRANGKYVAFLSCDDFLHDITAIQDVVNMLETNKGDFSYSPAYCRHPDGYTFLFQPAIYNVFQVMPCARQAMFFRKAVLERENFFDEKLKYLADFDLIIRLMMKKCKGLFFDGNYTTYKFGQKVLDNNDQVELESKMIFNKNYRKLLPMNDTTLSGLVNTSTFPAELLEKLSTFFPPEDKELFLERCETMRKIREQALASQNVNQAE